MKINLSAHGKFHLFDLARELHNRGHLGSIYSAYPRFKLKNESIPQDNIETYPWFHMPYMALKSKEKLPANFIRNWEYMSRVAFDNYVARSVNNCDVFIGLSSSCLKSGLAAKKNGAKYICDRGSAHIRYQNNLLIEEYDIWGVPFNGIDPRIIEREETEYDESDCITVPSTFAYKSFLIEGISQSKIKKLSYGVNCSLFRKVNSPNKDEFNILFVGSMSLQKGVQYLVAAFSKIHHKHKTLTFVGVPSIRIINLLIKNRLWDSNIVVLGHVPQPNLKNIMSKSHVMVLPSIQEGLAMVLAQAMACGCPVIASVNTGAEDLFEDGKEGYIVPIRNIFSLTEKLQYLADNPDECSEMGGAALQKVQSIGGWKTYGDKAVKIYNNLLN